MMIYIYTYMHTLIYMYCIYVYTHIYTHTHANIYGCFVFHNEAWICIVATSDGAISMGAGEHFAVIEKDQGDGWTRVRRMDGEDGFVPTSYIDCRFSSSV